MGSDAVRDAARPLRMGKLWMTGSQVADMVKQIQELLTKHGRVSLPSLHRHVILDSWLKPTVGQVLSSRMDKLLDGFTEEELRTQKIGAVSGQCKDCAAEGPGWLDSDVD